MVEVLSGDDLTQKHKFKKSDLARIQGASGLVWGSFTRQQRPVKSIRKSQDVRFAANLCTKCNNECSQSVDYACQGIFRVYLGNPGLSDQSNLDWTDVFGEDRGSPAQSLARYVVKHMRCRIIHDGYTAPVSARACLDGAPDIGEVELILIKSEMHHQVYLDDIRDNVDPRGPWNFDASGTVRRSRKCLTSYHSGLIIGFIGITYHWKEGSSNTESYLVSILNTHTRTRSGCFSTCKEGAPSVVSPSAGVCRSGWLGCGGSVIRVDRLPMPAESAQRECRFARMTVPGVPRSA